MATPWHSCRPHHICLKSPNWFPENQRKSARFRDARGKGVGKISGPSQARTSPENEERSANARLSLRLSRPKLSARRHASFSAPRLTPPPGKNALEIRHLQRTKSREVRSHSAVTAAVPQPQNQSPLRTIAAYARRRPTCSRLENVGLCTNAHLHIRRKDHSS